MALAKISHVTGKAVPVMGDDIDTDRIIPARFMKCVTFDGLGDYAFYDERFDLDESRKPFPLNDERFSGATILISGFNFGCGSSREHAPQSLYHFGFRGIVAGSFAEIFFGNATQLGVPCLSLAREDLGALKEIVSADPTTEVTLDVDNKEVRAGDRTFAAEIPPGARQNLLEGKWDPISDLLEGVKSVEKTAESLPYVAATR